MCQPLGRSNRAPRVSPATPEVWLEPLGDKDKSRAELIASPKGAEGGSGTPTVTTTTASFDFGGQGGSQSVSCGAGKVVTGGGFSGSGSGSGQIYTSAPTASGWTVSGKNTGGTVYALCMGS